MYVTQTSVNLQTIRKQLLNALDKQELTSIKLQHGQNKIKRVWQTLTKPEKEQIQTLCSIGSMKFQLLNAANKEHLTSLKKQYGEFQIKRVWKFLTDTEKAQIQSLCSQPEVVEVQPTQIDLTNYLEDGDFEAQALQLAKIIKQAESKTMNNEKK